MQKKFETNTKGTEVNNNKPSKSGVSTNKSRKSSSNKRNRESKANKFSNDPNWYAVDASILRDAASIPYSIPAGAPLPLAQGVGNGDARIPGVMAYKLAPTIGWSADPTDPINIAATQSYAFIRHANSGSANYEAPDIMLYYLAMADVYSYIEYLKRMYGVVQVYAQRNKYLPYTLLAAMGVNPMSLIENLANFRLSVNMLVNKAASFAVPNTMSIFPRRQFLYAGVYTEGGSIRDQLYLYTPHGFHLYNWVEGKTNYMPLTAQGIKQQFEFDVNVNDGLIDAMDLVSVGHKMIDLIINNEDMGIMNGDILKAYGDNVLKLSHLSEDYAIAPVYDPYVLEQMQNASIIPLPENRVSDMLSIESSYTQEDAGDASSLGMAVLVSKPQIFNLYEPLTGATYKQLNSLKTCMSWLKTDGHRLPHLISTMLTDPEAKDNMEITRLTAFIGEQGRIITGSEMCVEVKVYYKPEAGQTYQVYKTINQMVLDNEVDAERWAFEGPASTEWSPVIAEAACYNNKGNKYLEAFKFRPHVYVFNTPKHINHWMHYVEGSLNGVGESPMVVKGQISNYTVLAPEVLERMHLAAIMNEFATPHVSIKSV